MLQRKLWQQVKQGRNSGRSWQKWMRVWRASSERKTKMNKIVQLSEYDYSQLYEKAKLNDKEIKRLAETYYQERGVFRIDLKTGFQDRYNGNTVYYTTSFSTENGLYKHDGFKPILTEKGRRKIERIVKNLCDETFDAKFGNAIKFRNAYANALYRLKFLKWICYTIAFSGWGVAAAVLMLK